MQINLERLIPGTEHFYWGEVLLCPQWGVHIFPTAFQQENLIRVMGKLEIIREEFGKPIIITSGLRPKQYNKHIGGAKFSAHMEGKAIDFIVDGMNSDMVRASLEPMLEDLDLRMENLPNSSWIHIDIRGPGGRGRYFEP